MVVVAATIGEFGSTKEETKLQAKEATHAIYASKHLKNKNKKQITMPISSYILYVSYMRRTPIFDIRSALILAYYLT